MRRCAPNDGFGARSIGANSHVLKELISINRLYVTDITYLAFYQIVCTFYNMKRVVYIESRPNQAIWEKLVEIESGKIVFETPWKPCSHTIDESQE